VSLGAILGANTRFKMYSKLEKSKFSKDLYTLLINSFASFLLGLFLSIMEKFNSFIYSYQLILFFSVGFLGSLSTFSSFVYDLFDLCLQFKFLRAIKLFIVSLSIGIFAFVFGCLLGNNG
tara:strand:+ start:810 stop:1169 length:360 start_codon:yes stop_codon:yes gene_type:complete